MKKIELLAPAGDKESLIAAVQNGADAIYLGGTLFSARAFAKNFDDEQLQWAIQYAHLYDVKIYVTVNTLFKDAEIDALISYLDKLYEFQVDALIIHPASAHSLRIPPAFSQSECQRRDRLPQSAVRQAQRQFSGYCILS